MSEVTPMGSQVVYVCVVWCDHVWYLLPNLSNHQYLSYTASLRKLKKSVSCQWGLIKYFGKKQTFFYKILQIPTLVLYLFRVTGTLWTVEIGVLGTLGVP